MTDLFVNSIDDEGEKGIEAYVGDMALIEKNMDSIILQSDREKIRKVIEETGGYRTFHTFNALIFFLAININNEGMLVFMDCKNDEDNAFEFFAKMRQHGMSEEDKQMFMVQFFKLKERYDEVVSDYRFVLI